METSEQVKPPCGVLFQYSKADELKASIELVELKVSGEYPHIAQMMDDYGKTRDTIRACK